MKTAAVVIFAGLVLVISGVSFAQETGCPISGQPQGQQQMMGGGMMMQRPSPQMIASGDGGVIIMLGNKLYKYDKNLNLVKDAELKIEQRQQPKK